MEKSPESSPEFEFWMVGNPPPSIPHPQNLLTANELFADGVILPFNPNPNPNSSLSHEPPPPPPPPQTAAFPFKKWKQIFRSSRSDAKQKAKTASITSSPSSVGSAAELNIHIWPFSRSRSAGNAAVSSGSAAARPRASVPGRKSCSAPCSRSNSRGETSWSASKRWGPLAGGGVHVGRSAPVWQLRRAGGNGANSSNIADHAKKSNALNLNVNTCIGHGSQVRNCRGEDKEQVTGGDPIASGDGGDGGRGGGVGNGSLFNLRAIFSSSKKVY